MKKNNFLVILIITCTFLMCIPTISHAANEGSFGNGLNWSFTDGTLTISGAGNMGYFSSPSIAPWYSIRNSITNVIIENDVTSIAHYAFHSCSNLASITIGKDVTFIGMYAFYSCGNLKNVYLNDGSLHLSNISISTGNSSFENAKKHYFAFLSNNEVAISGTSSVTVGDKSIAYSVALKNNIDNVKYTTIFLKYPRCFSLSKIENLSFDEVSIEKTTEYTDYSIAEILCIYSYNDNNIPVNTPVEAFSIHFDIDTATLPQTATLSIDSSSVLMGATDYYYEKTTNTNVQILPKLAESVSIDGLSSIDNPYQYKAIISPEYTTNKDVVWSVNNTDIATITQDGILIPQRNGTVSITATLNDGSGLSAYKYVQVKACAKIDSLSTTGTWENEFSNFKSDYVIYVDNTTTTFDISATYTGGTLKVNDSTLLSGRTKSIELPENTTLITLTRANVENYTDKTYTLTIIKSGDTLITDAKTTENGYEFNIVLNKNNIESFETAKLVVALYDGSGKFIGLSPADVNGSDTKKVVLVETETLANVAKVMLWNGLDTLKPLCNATEITLK